MEFKTFFLAIPRPDRPAFAKKCGVSVGQLHNIAYGLRPCATDLAIEIEKASEGAVKVEKLCPEVDWAYLRNSATQPTAESAA
jgi:DNA-binding transcriptional regulator YdaS (Cro superfamily)